MHRHVARVLLYSGVVLSVVGLSKAHAALSVPAYDYTGSSRFAWSLAYIALSCLAAYGLGLPDLARGRRGAVVAAAGATSGGAHWASRQSSSSPVPPCSRGGGLRGRRGARALVRLVLGHRP